MSVVCLSIKSDCLWQLRLAIKRKKISIRYIFKEWVNRRLSVQQETTQINGLGT